MIYHINSDQINSFYFFLPSFFSRGQKTNILAPSVPRRFLCFIFLGRKEQRCTLKFAYLFDPQGEGRKRLVKYRYVMKNVFLFVFLNS